MHNCKADCCANENIGTWLKATVTHITQSCTVTNITQTTHRNVYKMCTEICTEICTERCTEMCTECVQKCVQNV